MLRAWRAAAPAALVGHLGAQLFLDPLPGADSRIPASVISRGGKRFGPARCRAGRGNDSPTAGFEHCHAQLSRSSAMSPTGEVCPFLRQTNNRTVLQARETKKRFRGSGRLAGSFCRLFPRVSIGSRCGKKTRRQICSIQSFPQPQARSRWWRLCLPQPIKQKQRLS